MKVVTGKEMQAIDQKTIEQCGISGLELMDRAGKEVALRAQDMLAETGERNVVIAAGAGNNGGDGLVAARYLKEVGIPVEVLLLTSGKLSLETLHQLDLTKPLLKVETVSESRPDLFAKAFDRADLIIDALFGTGFSGAPEGLYRDAIEAIGNSGTKVLSVDIASGVEADTGRVSGVAVRADLTVTFGLPKVGCVLNPGAAHCGWVAVIDIGFPPELLDAPGMMYVTELSNAAKLLPRRPEDTHKKAVGRVLGKSVV